MQNFIGIAQQNLASADAKEDAPWYIKYGARGFGTIAGALAMLTGVVNAIMSILDPICIVLSVWQVVVGFVVVSVESPCCCFFVDHVQTVSQKIDSKPLYFKAAAYILTPLPTLIFCFGFGTFFGGGMVMGAGVMYGFIALGKKASREEMARNAQTILPTTNPKATGSTDKRFLVENLEDPNPFTPLPYKESLSYPERNFGGPPPAYTDLQATNTVSNVPIDWNTPFTPPSSSVTNGGSTNVNPVSSNPYNPFQ